MVEQQFGMERYNQYIKDLYNPQDVEVRLAQVYADNKALIKGLYELNDDYEQDFEQLCARPGVVPIGLAIAQAEIVEHAIKHIPRDEAYSKLTQYFVRAGVDGDRLDTKHPTWTTFIKLIDNGVKPAYAAHLLHVIGEKDAKEDKLESVGPFKIEIQVDLATDEKVALIHADRQTVAPFLEQADCSNTFQKLLSKILSQNATHISIATVLSKEELNRVFPQEFVNALTEWKKQYSATDMTTWEQFILPDGTVDLAALDQFVYLARNGKTIEEILSHLPNKIHHGKVPIGDVIES